MGMSHDAGRPFNQIRGNTWHGDGAAKAGIAVIGALGECLAFGAGSLGGIIGVFVVAAAAWKISEYA